jgi:hypothetical protein
MVTICTRISPARARSGVGIIEAGQDTDAPNFGRVPASRRREDAAE